MALIPCPECQREVSTAAAACPHCGYPLQKETPVYIGFPEPKPQRQQFDDYEDDQRGQYRGHTCYACDSTADRACTRCGQLCCFEHSTWFHPIKHAGLVCHSCASWHWTVCLISLVIVGGIILVVIMGNIR